MQVDTASDSPASQIKIPGKSDCYKILQFTFGAFAVRKATVKAIARELEEVSSSGEWALTSQTTVKKAHASSRGAAYIWPLRVSKSKMNR